MAYEIKEFPQLSWSFSRMKMLQECPRKYYYNYYGYHNGWLREAGEESKHIYRLKNLQPIDAFFGQKFHEAVTGIVKERKKELLEPDKFRRSINRMIKEAYHESKTLLEDWRIHPKWYAMISEVYYEGDITQEKKDSIIKKINITSENIFLSKSFKELTENDVEIIELDELKSFEINGLTAYLKIDALYRVGEKYVLVDWKTSARDDSLTDVDQLILYSWYANNVLGIRLEDLEARLEFVQLEKMEKYQFSNSDLSLIDRRIDKDLKQIQSFLLDPEINQPLPKEKFFQTKGSSLCKYCNFREICWRG
ncbi:PD-(D/E)XK nuclease family protein [Desulfosporosinus hippei]|uniref:PD-(D/E)XK nuclease superfamily protein n=1 Tax=Desulfosporosinus hippei DSM 8344 TaxID=1121419 RepID=A0A1G8CGD7_9FIRM|nr:PD-(D/E)XK nuclease family protein [Desulfosporosinus hippei]SDH44526.1 PD-(D/E)XK nuclease superfamily protein [Desulfosporosinus hippei DSM 8344]